MIAFWFPMIRNFLPCSTSWATYSRKREKGGLVTTMSASFRSAMHSGLRKSPPGYLSLPFKAIRGGLVALEEELRRRRCSPRRLRPHLSLGRGSTASALGFWRLPFPSLYSGNKVPWPAMGEPS